MFQEILVMKRMTSDLILRGRGREEVLVGVKELGHGIRDGSFAVVGRLVDEGAGRVWAVLVGWRKKRP